MSNFADITQAYSDAVGRYLATRNLSGLLDQFRMRIEQELGGPPSSVVFFPIDGEPNEDDSRSPSVARSVGINSWQFGLAITFGNAQRVKYPIILDMRDGEYVVRIAPDGEPYHAKKDVKALANELAELAIEWLGKRSIDPDARGSYWIEMKRGQEPSAM